MPLRANYSPGKCWVRLPVVVSILVLLVFFAVPVTAQNERPKGPVYIVQEGDSLWNIAVRFGVRMEELQTLNNLADPGQLSAGLELVIPGLEGYEGRLDTREVSYGETLWSLSRRHRVPVKTLAYLNHLTSPAELYAGATLVLPAENVNAPTGSRTSLAPGESLLEMAVRLNTNPWTLAVANDLPGAWNALPGDVLLLPAENLDGPGALPEALQDVTLSPLPLLQGKTLVIKISGPEGLTLSGSLAGKEFKFFSYEGGYVALQGIHAMTRPGLYPLALKGKLSSIPPYDSEEFAFSQTVLIRSGEYIFDPVLTVDPETLDPQVTGPEDELWAALGRPVTPGKLWDGLFQSPVPLQFRDCWTSLFGNRRSYNGSAYNYFHSGLDFCGGEGTELYAPAAGKVVFTGPLTVRGNATVIDHGWGVYTAYDHQSEILVKPGDFVEADQLIGRGGSTGRTTGPHLHWEVWVGGVQVDPVDWLEKPFP
jgi:murein DD-endopeptidase MepM/ murein hydrolase activator NlpD